MTMIFTKDDLRASVEAASGGQCTVLYTASGHPCYMNIIPKFNLQDIDPSLGNGTHPAFIVNNTEKPQIFIGTFIGTVKDGELLSLPGVAPDGAGNFDQYLAWAAANGPGWHMMSAAEWSAIALWSWKNGTKPRGNNQYGRAYNCPWETGVRGDGLAVGEASGFARTLTGSGPASWRHNGQPNGIADLNGNVWEWNSGFRLQDGEIQVLPNNDAADNTKDQGPNSALWKAILAADGSLVTPGTAGTLKYDGTVALVGESSSLGAAILSDTIVNRSGAIGNNENAGGTISNAFAATTVKNGLTVPALAKALLIYPITSDAGQLGTDALWVRNHGERLPLAGAGYSTGGSAGVFARNLRSARSLVGGDISARPAFVL
ncbi:MAG: hypothetical protein LBS70_08030 [Candidatus Accumulibacter sp.]|jgi:hypothetical protein|nr:hypothetical protein [Accumulibacter sp.]